MTVPMNDSDVLTVDNAPELPNGTATVYRVAVGSDNRRVVLATFDKDGVLRSMNGKNSVFRIDNCEILEAVK